MKLRKPAFNVWPVMQRELREGARRPVNRRLRLLSAGVGTLLLWIVAGNSHIPPARLGAWLFAYLHTLLLGLIFLIAPALTADCVAREKREGTLGLLFMTPLSAGGIVAGKALAAGLRAFTLWLAVLPILTIPFTTGGVTWFDAFSALSLEFCAMALCLAAGLLASTLVRQRNAAFLLAYVLGAIFLCSFCELFGLVLILAFRGLDAVAEAIGGGPFVEFTTFATGFLDVRRQDVLWNTFTNPPLLARIWTWVVLSSPPVVSLFFCRIVFFATRQIERSWQDKIPSARRESLLRRYCTPLFRSQFRRKMQRTLDRNPIAWLQQYSWKARLSKWGLCLAFVLIVCATPRSTNDFETLATAMLLALAGIYTFFGVAGFLEEKRSGALELLLVTPISVNKIIFGRAWGLWKQFLPAGLVLAGFYGPVFGDFLFILAFGFLALPIFATYAALRVKNLIAAAVLTWIALPLPLAFAMCLVGMFMDLDRATSVIVVPLLLLINGASVMLTCFLLRHSLSRRIYAF